MQGAVQTMPPAVKVAFVLAILQHAFVMLIAVYVVTAVMTLTVLV